MPNMYFIDVSKTECLHQHLFIRYFTKFRQLATYLLKIRSVTNCLDIFQHGLDL